MQPVLTQSTYLAPRLDLLFQIARQEPERALSDCGSNVDVLAEEYAVKNKLPISRPDASATHVLLANGTTQARIGSTTVRLHVSFPGTGRAGYVMTKQFEVMPMKGTTFIAGTGLLTSLFPTSDPLVAQFPLSRYFIEPSMCTPAAHDLRHVTAHDLEMEFPSSSSSSSSSTSFPPSASVSTSSDGSPSVRGFAVFDPTSPSHYRAVPAPVYHFHIQMAGSSMPILDMNATDRDSVLVRHVLYSSPLPPLTPATAPIPPPLGVQSSLPISTSSSSSSTRPSSTTAPPSSTSSSSASSSSPSSSSSSSSVPLTDRALNDINARETLANIEERASFL